MLTSRTTERRESEFSFELIDLVEEWSLRDIGVVHSVLRDWRPDIVHLQFPSQGYTSSILPSLVPLLAWFAGAMPVRTWHEAFSGRGSTAFLLQSSAPGPYIVVRPNFVDLMWPPLRTLLYPRQGTFIAGASAIPRSTLRARERQALRERYLAGRSRLIVFFGFLYPAKGVEQLFQVADPAHDSLVIAGNTDVDPSYTAQIADLCQSDAWAGHAELAGFLSAGEIADLLAAADAVVLPFREGGGSWNSSISAALAQGTAVVTTAQESHGYDAEQQVYFAHPDDLDDLRRGLALVTSRGLERSRIIKPVEKEWDRIVQHHMAVYRAALAHRRPRCKS